jgi:hypothetical protein
MYFAKAYIEGIDMIVYRLDDIKENATLSNLVFQEGYTLKAEEVLGRFETEALPLPPGKKMVISWNAKAEKGSYIEIMIRTKTSKDWSPWMFYGQWCPNYSRGSVQNQNYQDVILDIDELISKESLTMCQIAFEITRDSSSVVNPILMDLFVAIEIKKEVEAVEVLNIDLEVPMISQMLIRDIGKIACSPTALTMIFNYYGLNFNAIDVARHCYDSGSDMYGNWSYNVAYAGLHDFEAYVDYCYDVSELITYIQCGIPIVASVKTSEIIEGAPQAYPEGHLIIIRGFMQEEEPYIIVNDPASLTEMDVKRYYKLSEFLKIWRHVIYVIKTRKKLTI